MSPNPYLLAATILVGVGFAIWLAVEPRIIARHMRNMLADSIVVHRDDQAEINRLRAQLDAPRSLCGECGGFLVLRCEHCGTVHEDTAKHKEIQEVTEQITCGHPMCGATWRDTEVTGWLWFCSLPHGHGGHHRCIGASW